MGAVARGFCKRPVAAAKGRPRVAALPRSLSGAQRSCALQGGAATFAVQNPYKGDCLRGSRKTLRNALGKEEHSVALCARGDGRAVERVTTPKAKAEACPPSASVSLSTRPWLALGGVRRGANGIGWADAVSRKRRNWRVGAMAVCPWAAAHRGRKGGGKNKGRKKRGWSMRREQGSPLPVPQRSAHSR